ncbi:hypothetical protein [Allohahella marinimesophila]|uniref:Uncharacterized protein n=1 Tax=Allohahella marinimesophila TaxID=1054972 RepID=A0ABP7NH98_9GAMM
MRNKQFWDFLLSTALEVEALETTDDASLARIAALIETVDIIYKGAFDPADAYEEYVAAALCAALHKKLPRQ